MQLRSITPTLTAALTTAASLALSVADLAAPARAVEVFHIAPPLMESTFRIEGPTPDGKTFFGTCFILAHPQHTNSPSSWNVLITANHVLEGIHGEQASMILRSRDTNGTYAKQPTIIQIRRGPTPLWTKHKTADVAAMVVALPTEFVNAHHWVSTRLLVGDKDFQEKDIRPGDELMCLGFPLGLEANAAGFPILRSGRIASFPLTPCTAAPTFLYDIPIYGGNSGGPVFFDFRKRDIPGLPSERWVDWVGIAGLISQDLSQTVHVEGYFETITRRDPLGLAVVVPAQFIIETVEAACRPAATQQGHPPLPPNNP